VRLLDILAKMRRLLGLEAGLDKTVFLEKRGSPRVTCAMDVVCRTPEGDQFQGLMTDLGLYGLRVVAKGKFQANDEIDVSPAGKSDLLQGVRYKVSFIRTSVVWARRKKKSPESMLGLRFSDTRSNLQDSWVASFIRKMGFSVGFNKQMRKQVRLSVRLPISYRTPRGEDARGGFVLDMGMGGVLVQAPMGLPPENEIRMIIGPLDDLEALCCSGAIVHSYYVKKTECWLAGVAFIKMTDRQSRLLTEYVETLIKRAL
jgi:c-di-GMP-binding flagellar brake protein YcgR